MWNGEAKARAYAGKLQEAEVFTLKLDAEKDLLEPRGEVGKWRYMRLVAKTVYCKRWADMRQILDAQTRGKNPDVTYALYRSCSNSCVYFWPQSIVRKFTYGSGSEAWAMRALSDRYRTPIFLIVKPLADERQFEEILANDWDTSDPKMSEKIEMLKVREECQ